MALGSRWTTALDWKQFVSSLVGSLAWPLVVVSLLLILRQQLAGLAGRLLKLSLPGGLEASFSEGLEKSREQAEQLAVGQAEVGRGAPVEQTDRRLELARDFPEASVMESFKEVEAALLRFKEKFPALRGGLIELVNALFQAQLIDQPTVSLFSRLRELRNLAAHGGSAVNKITPGEALEFAAQAHVLIETLKRAYETYEDPEEALAKRGSS
jgi:hypothetical protein